MYLIRPDFKKQIQVDNLNQIIGNDVSVLNAAIEAAEEEVASYLTQKYDMSYELSETALWNYRFQYNAGDRVYADADPYDQTKTYLVGDLVLSGTSVYRCSTAITIPESFTANKWAIEAPQNTIYYAKTPFSRFNLDAGNYATGDKVFWNGYIYTAIKPTGMSDYDSLIQGGYFGSNSSIQSNVFPDSIAGKLYWTKESAPYQVPVNTDVNNLTYWIQGDNRNKQILMYSIDIALFHLHSRIAPRNIPELRENRYNSAITWLKNAAKGAVTANIQKVQPKSGGGVRYGSEVKQRNNY